MDVVVNIDNKQKCAKNPVCGNTQSWGKFKIILSILMHFGGQQTIM